MTQRSNSAADSSVVSPNRVRETMIGVIGAARAGGWTLDGIAEASGVSKGTIRGWLEEGKEPSFSKAMSVAVVLGRRAVNTLLALIGYGGASPLDEVDEMQPMVIAAGAMSHLAVIAQAAADGRIDHTERPACRDAADHIIAIVQPLSSIGGAE